MKKAVKTLVATLALVVALGGDGAKDRTVKLVAAPAVAAMIVKVPTPGPWSV